MSPDKTSRAVRPPILMAVVLFSLPLIYFLPAVRGRLVLMMGDALSYSFLMKSLFGQMIRQGELPLWNPYIFAGMPFLAAIQPGLLYPPNWLFIVLPAGVAMNAVVIFTYYWSLLGTYLFARALRLERVGALAAAIAFSFGGFMICHIEDTNYIASTCWLPWILLAVEKIYASDSWRHRLRWAAAGGTGVALGLFAGLPQAIWQMILVAIPYFLFSLFLREGMKGRWKKRAQVALAAVVMAALGVMISAVQLLPTVELQQQGERAAIPYDYYSAFFRPSLINASNPVPASSAAAKVNSKV